MSSGRKSIVLILLEASLQNNADAHDFLIPRVAAGLPARTRSFPDEGERARVAVGKAIRRALARIAEADAVIGEHLRETVHTGVRCSYWPG